MGTVAAVDLGATSGRVVLGTIEGGRVRTEVVTRFPNRPVATPDGLHWNIHGVFAEVTDGIAAARRVAPDLAAVAVDSWAIDYGLMRDGRLIGNPYHYRDSRVNGVIDVVHAVVPPEELFRRNGLQHLPFTTVYQLWADRQWLDIVDTILLIPDLIGYWLTGVEHAERTNASTTGVLNVTSQTWDLSLCEQLGIPTRVLPPLVEAGVAIGPTLPYLAAVLGGDVPVVTVGSHDTASAVVAVPMDPDTAAYISCGTWGLVGVETDRPILTEQARTANFTNEAGVDGRNRFLHNVMGLWLLNESLRTWGLENDAEGTARLLGAATVVQGAVPVFDPNDPPTSVTW
jgi:rhamnulokinase